MLLVRCKGGSFGSRKSNEENFRGFDALQALRYAGLLTLERGSFIAAPSPKRRLQGCSRHSNSCSDAMDAEKTRNTSPLRSCRFYSPLAEDPELLAYFPRARRHNHRVVRESL